MMDETMVERVARAIARADEQNGGPPYDYRIGMGKHAKAQLFDEARAAIEAMREPTDRMVIAIDDQLSRWVREEGDAKDVFIAAIDAALAKGDER